MVTTANRKGGHMTKTVFWGLRVSQPLDERANAEAAKRGMNLSEFVRYAVSVFFDMADGSKPHADDGSHLPAEEVQP